jgi:hypothetical protein
VPAAVKLRDDYSAEELRALARRSKDVKRSKDVNQSRRLLSLAAVRDGMDRARRPRSGHGSPDLARPGAAVQRRWAGWALRQLDGWSDAAPVAGTTG